MIVLDANVLIAYLDREHVHHQRAKDLLSREIDDDFGANSLTIAEVLVLPARTDQLEVVQAVLDDLQIQEFEFPVHTPVKLARLRAETGLRMPDCCVLLVAEHRGARVASFDKQVIKVATARHLETLTD